MLRMLQQARTSIILVSDYLLLKSNWLTNSEGVSDAEMANAIHPDTTASTAGIDEPKPKKKGHRILAAFKSVTKGGVETVLGTDKLKAAAGAEHAKNRLGVLKDGPDDPAGPIRFPSRYKGKKGHAYITATATTPALSWTTEREDIDPVFSIAIADIMVILLGIPISRGTR